MRLTHFCIGSIKTQDLLISKTFIPRVSVQDNDSPNIQTVWATFLDLFQTEHHWANVRLRDPLSRSNSGNHNSNSTSHVHAAPPTTSGMASASARQDSPKQSRQDPTRLAPDVVSTPLFSKDTSFIYKVVNDFVLVACCPLPPKQSTLTSTVTQIPRPIPGQQQHILQSHGSTPPSSPPPPPPQSSSASHGKTTIPTPVIRTESEGMKPNKLAYTRSTSLQVSLHYMIEFLMYLTTTMERYVLGDNTDTSTATRNTRKASAAASATSPTSKSSTQSASSTLSADMLLLNLGIVYEILDECLEQGFPMMPSLAQLDLLVFGVPVTK